MILANILSNYSYTFLLVFIRYLGLFLIAPIYSSRVIPLRVKVGLVFFLTVCSLPLLQGNQQIFPGQPLSILLAIMGELAIGFTLGFIAFLVFAAIQLGGRFIDLCLGFAIVNIVDPIHGESMPLIGQFKNVLATLIFFMVNGHHLLLEAVYRSFELIPLTGFSFNPGMLDYLLRISGDLFLLAFKVALPVIGTVFVADIILGFLARTIPQMNFFMVGIPFKILLGFVMLLMSLHFLIYYFEDLFADMYRNMLQFLKLFS